MIRAFVPDAVLRHGVARAWLLLGGVGLLLLLLSVVVADQLARSLVRPLTALARAADRLAAGELSARAAVAGPPEVRRAGAGLNRLAVRIGELLAHERETVADLSHRLRTPLTALRIDAESLRDGAEMERLLADVGAVERTVSEIIREARRPGAGRRAGHVRRGPRGRRTGRVLAAARRGPGPPDDRGRGPGLPSRSSSPRMTWRPASDILLGNVFAHTPEGAGFAVRLSRRAAGGAWLVVADDGPGFGEAGPTLRGQSQRRLHRPRPGHRPPHRRGIRRHADHRAVRVGRRCGDARARIPRRAAGGIPAAPAARLRRRVLRVSRRAGRSTTGAGPGPGAGR